MLKTHLIGPITSLQFAQDLLLSGEGPYLCVHNVIDGVQLSSKHVLGNARIHGIRAKNKEDNEGTLFVVFGQKCFRVIRIGTLDHVTRIDTITDIISLPDLILDAHWLDEKNGSSTQVAIATAHNAVWHINYKTGERSLAAQCEENSILYSAKFFGGSLNTLLLAAGTVFNQVLLWQVKGQTQDNKTQILHRLTGHEGVIFQISFNKTGTLMVSVSDDRSIRLWKLVLSESNTPLEATQLQAMYGHGARVWEAKLLTQCIVSIGEDAVCNVWNYDGKLVKKFTGHLGKSIWSLATNEDINMIATGGGDGSIRLFSLDNLSDHETMATITAYLPGTDQDKVTKKGVPMDTPRSICLGNDGKILVMTSEGCLYEYSWLETIDKKDVKHDNGWQLVLKDPDYASYSLMSMSPDRKLVAFGNLAGSIKVCLTKDIFSQCIELKPFSSKVLSLLWSSSNTSYNLFSCGPDGIIIWSRVTMETTQTIDKIRTFCIPHSKQRWASAVEIVTPSSDHHGDCHVILGDRKGSVHLYDCRGAGQDDVLNPVQTLPVLHGAIGVTQLCSHDGRLFSTGRDGTYRQYRLCQGKLELIDTKKVFKGLEWVEKLVFTANGDIVITGFHTAFFVVWSVSKNEELLKVKCGGGHRAWDFSLHQLQGSQDIEAVFTYLKGNSINTYKKQLKSLIAKPLLKPSFHGRETTCMANVCDLPIDKESKHRHLFVTGSEDTTINLMIYDDNTGSTTKIFTAQGHISSVRALNVTKSASTEAFSEKTANKTLGAVRNEQQCHVECAPPSLFLLFSGGGRASLRCWRVDPTVLDDSGTPSSAPLSFICEYSSRTSNRRRRRKRKEAHLHSEIRFMSLCSFPLAVAIGDDDSLGGHCSGLYGVAAACSDGFVRIFIFDEKDSKFFLLAQTQYLLRCVLSVQHVVYKDPTSGRSSVLVIAGDTAGKITIWDITEQLVEYVREEIDENDIKQDNVSNKASISVAMEANLLVTKGVTMATKSVSSADVDTGTMTSRDGLDDVAMTAKLDSSVTIKTDILTSHGAIEDVAMTTNSGYSVVTVTNHDDVDQERKEDQSLKDNNASKDPVSSTSLAASSKFSCINLVDSSLGQPLHVFKAHQSGVNDISVYQGSSSFILCSGGDDSALFVAEFQVGVVDDGSCAVHVIREEIIQSAHTSSVTGVRLLDEQTMMSSSTDQRLKRWTIDKTCVKLDHVIFVDVPDVQAIESWRTGMNGSHVIAVCGVGLQTIQLKP